MGERIKCEITAALAHDPKLIILDEPTIGLDLISKIELRNYIKHITTHKDDPRGVLITSHDMADIDTCADSVVFFDKGKIIYDDYIYSFNNSFGAFYSISITPLQSLFSKEFMDNLEHMIQETFPDKNSCFLKSSTLRQITWIIDKNIKSKVLQLLTNQTKNIDCKINLTASLIEDIYLMKYKSKDVYDNS